MNFDKIEELLSELNEDERKAVEYSLSGSIGLMEKYAGAAYAVPFQFINFDGIVNSFIDTKHEALTRIRKSRFTAEDFPELDYGDMEGQPAFATAFADYVNLKYACTIREFVDGFMDDGIIELAMDGDDMQYVMSEEHKDEKDNYKGLLDYANIFL